MPIKPDHNMCIKDYMSGLDKQSNKTKTKMTEHTKSNNKQSTVTKTTTMNKEGGTSVKTKTPKPSKSDKSITDDPTGNSNQKMDASSRSPLEGNPEKNQEIMENQSLLMHMMMQMMQYSMKTQHV